MYLDIPFPSFRTYFELVKAFHRSLSPNAVNLVSRLQQPVSLKEFRFATGTSQHSSLSVAVVECINQVQQKLGHGVQPDLCQLLVTVEPYARHLSLGPKYVQEIFGTYGFQPPVLIGGAVEGLVGLSHLNPSKSAFDQQFSMRPALGVSLMAAVLPGVKLHAFHTETSDLPALPWNELLKVGYHPPYREHKAAAVILAEPHFSQVNEFLGRLQNAMPGMPMLGGVLRHNAWGSDLGSHRSMRGALFLGEQTVESGAVGCILTGALQVDAICAQGCRPVGPKFTVTAHSSEGHQNFITALDGKPALRVLIEAQQTHLEARDRLLGLQVGVDASGLGEGFVQYSPKQGPPLSLNVGMADVREGSLVQLHVQDPIWARQKMQQQLQRFAEGIPEEVKRAPNKMGVLLYSCTAASHDESAILESALQQRLPSLAFQGTKVQGEFGRGLLPDADGSLQHRGRCLLQSFSSSFGFFRQDVTAAAGESAEMK